jgi:hypoxanthine phosphoribosyltransferase
MIEKPTVLFDEARIAARVAALGHEISGSFGGEPICVIGLMKSSFVFMADLIRKLELDLTCHFLPSSALRGESAAGRTDITYSIDIPYAGRNLLLLDDVVDTGITLSFLLDHIREDKPRSLKICALVDKPGERKIDVKPEWAAFTIEEPMDRFLVGYGLDYAEAYRSLPYIGTIPWPAQHAARRGWGGANGAADARPGA